MKQMLFKILFLCLIAFQFNMLFALEAGIVKINRNIPTFFPATNISESESRSSVMYADDTDGDGVDNSIDLDDDNDGILDSNECGSTNRVANAVFPTSGTSDIPNWTVLGAPVTTNSNGILFNSNGATATTLRQIITGNPNGAVISLNNIYWTKTTVNTLASAFTFTISYGGVIYATINSTATNTPTITASNGATINITTLPTVTTAGPVNSTKTTLIITLPISGLVAGGYLSFNFVPGTDATAVRDLGFTSVSMYSCGDTDADGISDSLDLDADGDGCYDAVEGDENVFASQLNANGSISGAVNANGVPVLVNAGGVADIGGDIGQGVGLSTNATQRDCTDIDGDGVTDYVDLDDDNDGIPDLIECKAVEKVVNGNFGTQTVGDFTGWIRGGTVNAWEKSSGWAIEALNDNLGTSTIKQTITGLKAGKAYTITFGVMANGDPVLERENTLTFTIDGINYYTQSATQIDAAVGRYALVYKSITFIPTSTSAVIEFISTVSGAGIGGKDVMIRSVSLLPCEQDTDTDGIPDYLDLDSDGDGCFDAVEGDENVTRAQLNANGSISGAVNNANGVPALVNTGGGADVGSDVGQGAGNSADAGIKDAACYTLILNPDVYSGVAGTVLTTGNILTNDLLEGIVPVIGTNPGQVAISQSGVWPAGITLNSTTGVVTVANTVNGGVYVVNYQVCVNATNPALCQTQTITINLCGKFPLTGTPDSYTKTGISDLAGFANGWPGNVPNGFVAIESKNKGFVITRVSSVSAIPTADLVEGMLVYDIAAACIKLYNGTTWNCLQRNCN